MSSSIQSTLIEQLQKKCLFWKRMGVSAFSALFLVIIFGFVYMNHQCEEYQARIDELQATDGEANRDSREGMEPEIPLPPLPEKVK